MDTQQPPAPARPVVEVSITRLATALFSGLALMFSFGALIVASTNKGGTKVAQGGTVKPATTAVLDQSAIPSGAVDVSLTEFSFTPKMVMVEKGGALKVTDGGAAQHTLSVEGADLVTPTLNPKDTVGLSLGALEPGAYTISCTIPGHKAAGMTGELHVLAAGQTVIAGPAPPTNADAMDAAMAARTKAFPAPTAGLGGQLLPPTVLADGTKEFDLTTKIVDWEIEPGKIVKA
jgi:uncharacterized cupredoxin-like copper-binding protein